MGILVNDSPFAGREGKFVTARHIKERLVRETRTNVSLQFRETDTAASSPLDAVRHAYELLVDDLCEDCPRRGEAGKDVLYYMI